MHSPESQMDTPPSNARGEAPAEQKPAVSPLLMYAGVFVVGLLIGWFVLGWYLFPVQSSDVYPSDLRPDIRDDYILMVAEAYGATHDLRTAAKRLRYWEPGVLAVRIKQMSQALARVEPERSVYLEVLAKDLHLDASAAAPAQPPPPSRSAGGVPLSSILGMIAFIALLGLAFYLAKRRGFLDLLRRRAAEPEEAPAPPPTPQPPADTTYQDIPVHTMPVTQPAAEEEAAGETQEAVGEELMTAAEYEFIPLPDREAVRMPQTRSEAAPPQEASPEPAPWEPDFEEASLEESPEDFINHIETPEDFTTVPAPPPVEVHTEARDEEPGEEIGEAGQIRTLQFDGSPDYNMIAPIEIDDDFGQFVLGVALTAPHNPNQVIALEVMLYDRNDIRTVTALLAPPVLANDPELLRQFTDKEQTVFPLQPGQPFHLETAYLMVTGKVRRVQFGPRTRDGVPVIEFAEIEFVAERAGEGL